MATSSMFFLGLGNHGGSKIGVIYWPMGGEGKINSIHGGVTCKNEKRQINLMVWQYNNIF